MKWKTALIFLMLAGAALPQSDRVAIWVQAKTSDEVGKTFVYQLREQIAHSALYSLAESRERAVLELSVLSQSQTGVDENNSESAFSVALILITTEKHSEFLDQFVITKVGVKTTPETVRRLMTGIDTDVQDLKAAASKNMDNSAIKKTQTP